MFLRLIFKQQFMSLRRIFKHNHHFWMAFHVTVFTTALYRPCIVPPTELRFDQPTSRNPPPPSVAGAQIELKKEIFSGRKKSIKAISSRSVKRKSLRILFEHS